VNQTTFWAIGDTHLSFSKPRDFTHFGEKWRDHAERIADSWRRQVRPQDVVLLLGDTSWASSFKQVLPDLEWLSTLPGRKVLVRGNHDHWWNNINKVRQQMLPAGFVALQGDSIILEDVVLCGAQGHIAPPDPYYRPDPPKNRYERELNTLQTALSAAAAQRSHAHQPLIIMMHYPPFTSDAKPTAFIDLIEQYAPATCLYAHLHKTHEWEVAINGERNGIQYRLVAADYVNMELQQVYPYA